MTRECEMAMESTKKNILKLKSMAGSVGLLLTLMIYTAIGGLVFRYLELPIERIRLNRIRAVLLEQRSNFMNQVLNNANSSVSNFSYIMQIELQSYETAMQEAIQGGFSINSVNEFQLLDNRNKNISNLPPIAIDRWSIIQAVFFASTVLTTIGYGNVVPSTIWGRLFCIFFAFIGIPLTLTVIAQWGKLFAEAVSELASKISATFPFFITRFYPQNTTGQRSLGALAAIGLLFIYISFGGMMFMIWEEDWNFFDGFYFCFVTMTTIGFGDLVPKKPKYMLACTLYILVGLALTGTIIELVRRQYAQSWRRLQALRGPIFEVLRKIGEQAGGDVSIMQSDLKNLLTVIAMPKLKLKKGRNDDKEWQEAVEAVLRDLAGVVPDQNHQKPIIQIVIYESSV